VKMPPGRNGATLGGDHEDRGKPATITYFRKTGDRHIF
ncbi:hypothetical protein LCGC14_2932890, partial [marine sediment metagenome]